MSPIETLTQIFSKFPGIGPRQAKRFVYYILRQDTQMIQNIVRALTEAKNNTASCELCGRFFSKQKQAGNNVCNICGDSQRNPDQLMIVEKDVDMDSIESSGIYKGYYVILGGTIPVMEKKYDSFVRLSLVLERINTLHQKNPNTPIEIIMALSFTPHGEHTTEILKETLEPLQEKNIVKISSLGKGLSLGSELEYADKSTITHALKNRI